MYVITQSDAYQTTGCYNLLCSGFVQTNNRIAIGAAISPTSSYDGGQYDITILIWKVITFLTPKTKSEVVVVGSGRWAIWYTSLVKLVFSTELILLVRVWGFCFGSWFSKHGAIVPILKCFFFEMYVKRN